MLRDLLQKIGPILQLLIKIKARNSLVADIFKLLSTHLYAELNY